MRSNKDFLLWFWRYSHKNHIIQTSIEILYTYEVESPPHNLTPSVLGPPAPAPTPTPPQRDVGNLDRTVLRPVDRRFAPSHMK